MKKLWFKFTIILSLLLFTSSIWVSPAAALLQSKANPLAVENGQQAGEVNFSFAQLGEEKIQLRSPLDAYQVDFSLPYRWVVQEGEQTFLELSFNLTLMEDSRFLTDAEVFENLPHLEVYIDDVLIDGFTPAPGFGQQVRIPIPAGVFPQSKSNSHTLSLFYFRDSDCENFLSSVLEINNLSAFNIDYEVAAPVLSLVDFPRPLVQDSFMEEHLYLVLPDAYTEADLSAAAVVSAAIGDQGRGSVEISTLFASEATPEALTGRNVIAIGQPNSNAFISQAYAQQALSTGLVADGTLLHPDGSQVTQEDGVLQMFTPAGLNGTVYLLVTGGSEQAVQKAAYALASANPQYGLANDWSVIDQVYASEISESGNGSDGQLVFDDLGYHDTEYIGIGTRSDTFTFYVPHNWELTDTPSVTVSYAYSSILSETNSVINLELNGKLVGSVPILKDVLGETQATIQLRAEDFAVGEKNRMRITPIMDLTRRCERYDTNLTWLRIHGDSFFNIPHDTTTNAQGISAFTSPFFYLLSSPENNKILFNLPADASKIILDGFVQTAKAIGQERRFDNQEFSVSFQQTLPERFVDYHIITIGTPTSNMVIQEVNDALPQSFVPGENTLNQVVGNVEYVLADDFSVGVVEVIASPLNPNRGLSVITGTTEEGLAWALNAFSNSSSLRQLTGDLSFVSGEIIESLVTTAATRKLVQNTIEGVVGEEVNVETNDISDSDDKDSASASSTDDDSGFGWGDFLPVLFGALLVVGLLVTGISFARNLRTDSKTASDSDESAD
jgi:hypothetical protein